jgi:hypothetical protein
MQTTPPLASATYAIDAMRRTMIFGVALILVRVDMSLMINFGIVMFLVVIPGFNRAMTK